MASRKLRSKHGIKIEVWETSMRVGNSHQAMSIGRNFRDDQIIEFVDGIYLTCFDKAELDAKTKVFIQLSSTLERLVYDE